MQKRNFDKIENISTSTNIIKYNFDLYFCAIACPANRIGGVQ